MKLTFNHYKEMFQQYILPQRGKVILLMILLLSGLGLQLISPQLMRYYIDASSRTDSIDVLKMIAISFIGLALINQIVQLLETYIGEKVAWTATNALRQTLSLHCLKLDMPFHQEHTSGEMIERIDGDVSTMANFFSRFVLQIIGNILLIFGIVVVLFYENKWIGCSFAVFIVGALFLFNKIRAYAVPYWVTARQLNAKFFGFLGDRLAGVDDIRSNRATSYVMTKFFALSHKLLLKERKAFVRARALWPATIVVFALGYTMVFALGLYMIRHDVITIGMLFLMFYYMDSLRTPIENITLQMEDFQKASASIVRIQELLLMESSIKEDARTQFPEGSLSVEFKNVTFGYQQHVNVLHQLSFRLQQGKKLGILGRTGSGKTTISKLLLRLYDVSAGEITIGGKPIMNCSLEELYTKVSIVTQDIRILNGTVRDNITLFSSNVEDSRIEAIVEEIGLGNWLRALPKGLDTEITSENNGMSAGQAQLLAFARAFLKDSGLVILDEASARVDAHTEKAIEKATKKLLENRTAIIIAHRLQTIQQVDEIMIIENGEILEHENRKVLEKNPSSLYAQLHNANIAGVLK